MEEGMKQTLWSDSKLLHTVPMVRDEFLEGIAASTYQCEKEALGSIDYQKTNCGIRFKSNMIYWTKET